MDNTRVDDMLIEMIKPKIKEIEEKFSNGTGLTQDDINTLLLKSQYNHINHLDDKLNEVTASVVALESKFELLRADFATFKSDMEVTIQKSLNKNMMAMMAMMGFFVVLSKIIDKF
jgi:archaellum component FlaC